MNSIWSQTADRPQFEPLYSNIKVDVLIIGGGLAGILCAHMLAKEGVSYALVEADRICSGITKNTTAKLTFQHGPIYEKLIRTFGKERAQMYLLANRRALERYRELCRSIDCDFEEKSAFVYSLTDREKLEREAYAYEKLGVQYELVTKLPLPFKTAGAVRIDRQAQFHPLKFAYEIARGLNIFESTKVQELTENGALTNRGKIQAKKIIVATHFPLLNKHGSYFLKLYQDRSYVVALKNAAEVGGMYIDESGKGLSFRNYGNLLLLGGGSHRTGKSGDGWKMLENAAKRFYPSAEEQYRWAAQDCMTLDGMPYIGRYSASTPNLYVATGFNKWGMTSSMVSAAVLCDLVLGRRNEYAEAFDPSRSMFHPQLAVNAFESVIGLLTPTVPRCPHLGCALKYNKQEHSWDCPCHGSRFERNGKLIDGPATDDKKL